MKASVEINDEGWVIITVEFETGDREFGHWRWNVSFVLGKERDENRTLIFGVYDPKMSLFLKKWTDMSEAQRVIQALLDKGGYHARTIMPTEPYMSGYLTVLPNTEVQTAKLDIETINVLKRSLDYIVHNM